MRDKGGKVDDSAMAKVTVRCQGCGDFEATSYHSTWRKHLLEEGHQEKAREKVKAMAVKEKKRTVVVFGVTGVEPKDLLKYFGDLTFVTNIVFWGEMEDFCVITFLSSRFREAVLKTSHIVRNKEVYLRPLDDIPEFEWISICPFAAPDKASTVKMETGDDNDDYEEETSDEGMSDLEAGAGARAASFHEGSREKDKPEDPSAATLKNMSEATIIDPTPESRSNVAPFAHQPESEISAAEIEIVHFGPQNRVLDTIDIDDSDSDSDNENPSGIVETAAMYRMYPNPNTADNNNRQEFLNSIMEDFYNVNLMPETEWEFRQDLTNHLQSMLRGIFPNCILIQHGFGSMAESGQGTPLFYLDANGATGDRHPVNQHDMNTFPAVQNRQKLTEIAQYFEAYFFPQIANLNITRREQLTFHYNTFSGHEPIAMKCSIRISDFLSVQSNRLVKFLLKLDNRVRPLMVLTRYWANHHNFVKLNDNEFNSSKDEKASELFPPALIQWIVIFFFINKKILPTIDSLQTHWHNYTRAPLIVQGEDISFCDDPQAFGWVKKNDYDKNPATQNPSATCVLGLAHELFRVFGDQDYIRNSVISPNLGEFISKKSNRHDNHNALKEFDAFKKAESFLDPRSNDNEFIVQHPLKLGINMASDVSSKVFQRFQEQCRFTADCLFHFLNSEEVQNPIILLILPFENAATPPDQPNNTFDRDMTDQMLVTDKNRCFKIRLQIRKGQAVQMWLNLFEDFNNTVWPVCFGVKLYQLDTLLSSQDGADAETYFLSAFKGVVTKPDALNSWAYQNQTPKKMKKKIMALYTSLLVERRKKREIEKPSNTLPNKAMEELFSFDCQVVGRGWNLETEHPNATIDLFFTNVRNQDARYIEGSGGKFRQHLQTAYNVLWTKHVRKCFGQASESKRKGKKHKSRKKKKQAIKTKNE